jgi:hypothetical protein
MGSIIMVIKASKISNNIEMTEKNAKDIVIMMPNFYPLQPN